MQVEEVLTHAEYYRDRRFASKIPDYSTGKIKNRCGDNIYEYVSNGKYRQLPSIHTKEAKENYLSGENVLISKKFYYHPGGQLLFLPSKLYKLKVGRGHKNRFSEDVIKRFLKFIAGKPSGRCANPTDWNDDDKSCNKENQCGSSCRKKGVRSRFLSCSKNRVNPCLKILCFFVAKS